MSTKLSSKRKVPVLAEFRQFLADFSSTLANHSWFFSRFGAVLANFSRFWPRKRRNSLTKLRLENWHFMPMSKGDRQLTTSLGQWKLHMESPPPRNILMWQTGHITWKIVRQVYFVCMSWKWTASLKTSKRALSLCALTLYEELYLCRAEFSFSSRERRCSSLPLPDA